jgi:hypothetical protein
MHVLETGALRRRADQVVDGLACHRLAALGDEQPRQLVLARAEIALDGAEFVATPLVKSIRVLGDARPAPSRSLIPQRADRFDAMQNTFRVVPTADVLPTIAPGAGC